MIRGSDGLDYEDLAARLVGEPAETSRNSILTGHYSRGFKDAYRETYDYHEAQGRTTLDRERAAFAQACIAAGDGAHDDRIAALAHTYDPSALF